MVLFFSAPIDLFSSPASSVRGAQWQMPTTLIGPRLTPPMRKDYSILNSWIQSIRSMNEFPQIPSTIPSTYKLTKTPVPEFISSIFEEINQGLFGNPNELALYYSDVTLAQMDSESKVVLLSKKFIDYLLAKLTPEESHKTIELLLIHEICHYLSALHSHYFELTPLGYINLDLNNAPAASELELNFHIEIDMMTLLLAVPSSSSPSQDLKRSFMHTQEYLTHLFGSAIIHTDLPHRQHSLP